jgi:hypothetical protein
MGDGLVEEHRDRRRGEHRDPHPGLRRDGEAGAEEGDRGGRHLGGGGGPEGRQQRAVAPPGELGGAAVEGLLLRLGGQPAAHHPQPPAVAPDGQPQGEAHVVSPHRPGDQTGELEQLGGDRRLGRPDRQRRLGVGRRRQRPRHLADRLGESPRLDRIAGGEPGAIAAHQPQGEALLAAHPQPGPLVLRRQLDLFAALEERLGEILGLLGDLRQGTGDGGGVQRGERHGGQFWHRSAAGRGTSAAPST